MKTVVKFVVLILMITLGSSCDDLQNDIPADRMSTRKMNELLAFRFDKGTLDSISFGDERLYFQKIQGRNVFQGDILLTDEQLGRGKKDGMSIQAAPMAFSPFRRWAKSTVPYTIEYTPQSSNILAAISHIEANSNVRFVQRTNQSNYIVFIQGDGCSSYVGCQGGRQEVSIGPCSMGSIVHEIGHALGLWHEQSRPDRDETIVIHWENIEAGREHNFDKVSTAINYGTLDLNSIMMYDSWAFSTGGPTITLLNGTTFGSNRTALSLNDSRCITELYPPSVRNTSSTDVGTNASGATFYVKLGRQNSADVFKLDGTNLGGNNGNRRIAVHPNGNPYATGSVLQYYAGGVWNSMSKPAGTGVDIAIGGGGVIYLAVQNLRAPVKLHRYNGSWAEITNAPNSIKAVAVDGNDQAWVVTDGIPGNDIYRYSNGAWTSVPAPRHNYVGLNITDIGSSGNVVYITAKSRTASHIFRYSPTMNNWLEQPIDNSFLQSNGGVSCSANGDLFL